MDAIYIVGQAQSFVKFQRLPIIHRAKAFGKLRDRNSTNKLPLSHHDVIRLFCKLAESAISTLPFTVRLQEQVILIRRQSFQVSDQVKGGKEIGVSVSGCVSRSLVASIKNITGKDLTIHLLAPILDFAGLFLSRLS